MSGIKRMFIRMWSPDVDASKINQHLRRLIGLLDTNGLLSYKIEQYCLGSKNAPPPDG